MNAPVILPSYMRTLLAEERADSSRATQTEPVAWSTHATEGGKGPRNAWVRKFVKTAVHTIDEAARRIFAHEEPEGE